MAGIIGWMALAGVGGAGVIREGPRACKAIALTFDMCPVRDGSGYDAALVQSLVEKQLPATFFMSGRWMVRHDEQVRSLLQVPFFEVGTHGQVHAHLPLLTEDSQRREIQEAVLLLGTRYGRQAPLFRPPYGEYTDATVRIAEALGLRVVLWNLVSGDPDPHLTRAQIVKTVRSQVRGGSIIVMHGNGKGRHTREVLDDLYKEMILIEGYQALTVSDLLSHCQGEPGRDRGKGH